MLKRYGLLGLHWFIILNFLVEIIYASYIIFSVLKPAEIGGPLMEQAKTIDLDLMTRRRLYAIECWLAISGLAIYLAITEMAPRLQKSRVR
ncbi:MAG: hypothetical protein VYA30_16840 [Myxococcota bacterium]|nr:hypothetical protein [Myxococcota bacterium]